MVSRTLVAVFLRCRRNRAFILMQLSIEMRIIAQGERAFKKIPTIRRQYEGPTENANAHISQPSERSAEGRKETQMNEHMYLDALCTLQIMFWEYPEPKGCALR